MPFNAQKSYNMFVQELFTAFAFICGRKLFGKIFGRLATVRLTKVWVTANWDPVPILAFAKSGWVSMSLSSPLQRVDG